MKGKKKIKTTLKTALRAKEFEINQQKILTILSRTYKKKTYMDILNYE